MQSAECIHHLCPFLGTNIQAPMIQDEDLMPWLVGPSQHAIEGRVRHDNRALIGGCPSCRGFLRHGLFPPNLRQQLDSSARGRSDGQQPSHISFRIVGSESRGGNVDALVWRIASTEQPQGGPQLDASQGAVAPAHVHVAVQGAQRQASMLGAGPQDGLVKRLSEGPLRQVQEQAAPALQPGDGSPGCVGGEVSHAEHITTSAIYRRSRGITPSPPAIYC
mmetsp:Transcript_65804/g.175955  ORF Transcript_65804/g.175955 Transcript_65804/m.175955 type:complete len:220 (-) Transcript_65804:133-792(-)